MSVGDANHDVRYPGWGEIGDGAISEDAAPVCLGCMTAVTPETRYCPKCGRPVGMFVGTDPIQLIHSQGWGYRAAVRGRPNRVVLWGMWLVFGLATALMFSHLWDLARFWWRPGFVDLLAGLLILGLQVAYVALLYRVTKNYVRHRRYGSGRCGVCKYDLRLLTEPRCPECGTGFDPGWVPERVGRGLADQDVT